MEVMVIGFTSEAVNVLRNTTQQFKKKGEKS
jgi:hypothetical protein